MNGKVFIGEIMETQCIHTNNIASLKKKNNQQ